MVTQERTSMGFQPALEVATAQQAATDLTPFLAELQDLALKAKHAHWNIVGPNFRSIHLQLDELTDEYRTWTDTVAERIVALGVPASGQARDIAESTIEDLPEGPIAASDVVHLLAERLDGVIKRARSRRERLAGVDAISEGIVIDIMQGLEKQLWMLRAQEA